MQRLALVCFCCFSVLLNVGYVQAMTVTFAINNTFPHAGTAVEMRCDSPEIPFSGIERIEIRNGSNWIAYVDHDCDTAQTRFRSNFNITFYQLGENSTIFVWADLALDDTNVYHCTTSACASAYYKSPDVNLYVIVPPDQPTMNISTENVFENESVALAMQCSGKAGYPNATLTLLKMSESSNLSLPLLLSYSDSLVTGLYNETQTFTRDDHLQFQCVLTNELDKNCTAVSPPVTLVVEYPPTAVQMFWNGRQLPSNTDTINEFFLSIDCDESGELNCTADANPRGNSSWTVVNGSSDVVQVTEHGNVAIVQKSCESSFQLSCDVSYVSSHQIAPVSITASLTVVASNTTTTTSAMSSVSVTTTETTDSSVTMTGHSESTATTTPKNQSESTAFSNPPITAPVTTQSPQYVNCVTCGSQIDYTVWFIVLTSLSAVLLIIVIVFLIVYICRSRKQQITSQVRTKNTNGQLTTPREAATAPAHPAYLGPQLVANGSTDNIRNDHVALQLQALDSTANHSTDQPVANPDSTFSGYRVSPGDVEYTNYNAPTYSKPNKEAFII